ncbi:MAG: phosphonate ABC transporter ATP-binding protein [Clostridiales bacterium]|nr:phosphonate ABC transporter ATP-binding protein [Clostridiales bacterium]
MQTTILELHKVQYSYNRKEMILHNVDLKVNTNEFVSIIGPSGAGKTTLLRMINGMILPTNGEINLYGQRFDTLTGKKKQVIQHTIGTIVQDFCLVENVSCLQNVLNAVLSERNFFQVLAGSFTKDQKERAFEALALVGLQEKAEVKAKLLSGGQKQRVAIARAIMQQPKLLLADEPVASLDPVTAEQILSLLKNLQEKYGITVLMNSHNLEQALQYSNRILGINRGRIVIDTIPQEVTKEKLHEIYGEVEGLK